MRTLSRIVVELFLLFLPVAAQAGVKMTFTPSQSTVATTQVQDLTVFIPGTGTKVVKLQVCDFNGANCVTAGNSTLGTLAEVGRDSNNNPLVRYTAPTALPASTVCQPVDTGCRLKLKAKLKGSTKKAFATVTLTAPGVTGSPTGGGDGSSNRPVRSANGRFVAFASLATNLIGAGNDSNGFQDVFLFDTCLGASPCTPGISRVSVANDGSEADGPSHSPAISADGRFITFVSSATNLLGPGGDTNGLPDIYLRDTCLGGDGGCVPTTLRVSEGSEPDDFSDSPAISGNGRYVVFRSAATNLLGPGSDTNGHPDIFLRDTCLGADPACVPSTVRVSEATDGTPGNGSSDEPAVSDDGRYVVFSSIASTLVGGDGNGARDLFLRDTCLLATIAGCSPTTTRVSVDTLGDDPGGDSVEPVISGNGRFVVFRSAATDLIGSDINSLTDVFLRDTCLGAGAGCTPTTTRVSVASDGSEAAGGDTLEPVVSADGRFVAFRSAATNLVSADGNGAADIFVRDLCGAEPGCTPSTRRISVTSSGGEGAAGSFEPSLSGDGRFAAFISASDLTGDGSGGAIENVFLARTGAVIVPLLWVTNHDANTVSVIDTELNTVITTIPVGTSPKGIVLSPDGTRAYVTNYDDDTVSVIDTASRTVIATIAVGDGPWGLTWSPNVPTVLYVSNNLADTVSAISTTGNEVFATIALSPGACPRGMGSGGDGAGTLAYCLDEIEVFNTDPADPVDYHTIVPADFLSVGDGPAGAALVHDDSNHDVVRLYVSLENIDRVQVFDTDTEPDTLIATIVVGDKPNGAALTPDLSRVYVANSGSGTVSVINTANNSVIKTVTVGSNPTGVGISPDGARVYVTNRGSNTVSVIDTSTNAVVATIAVGAGPCCEQGIAIQLGRSL